MKELSKWKLLTYWDRIQEIVQTRDTRPVTLEIDPINQCNHNCRYCADGKFKRTSDRLSLAMVGRILEDASALGVKSVIYKGGGEPTLHSDLDFMIEMAYQKGLKIGLLTNGVELSSELIALIVNRLSYIRISLDALSRETYRYWHRAKPGEWERVLNNIRMLVNQKRRLKSPIVIGVNILYDQATVLELKTAAILELVRHLEMDVLSFRKAFMKEYGYTDYWASVDLQQDHDQRIAALKAELQDAPCHVMFDASRGQEITHSSEVNLPFCLATPLIAVVCADARLYPCCDLRYMRDYAYGNLHVDSFQEIWKSDRRKDILNRFIIPKKCFRHCTHRFAVLNEALNYLIDPDKPHVEFL